MAALFFRKRIEIKCAEPLGVVMAAVCPICKSPAQELPRTGDTTGFDCPTHGKFKVADTIAAEECTRQRWEAALRKAKLRAKPWEVPTVMSEDLFW
jgi:uncharacterized Zn finger protein (UPF0148 family)